MDYVRSAKKIDVLVTELDVEGSPLGGCNLARDVKKRFPKAMVYVFSDETADAHRLAVLNVLTDVTILKKPFGALFLSRRIRETLTQEDKT